MNFYLKRLPFRCKFGNYGSKLDQVVLGPISRNATTVLAQDTDA